MIIEVLTGILVVITGVYAFLTLRIAKASERSVDAVNRQSEAALRAYVTIAPFVRPQALFLYLLVSNTGRTAAENLRMTIDRDFFQWGKRPNRPHQNLREQDAFQHVIASFAPGAELRFGLGQPWIIFGEDADLEATPLEFSVTATYEFFGKQVTEVTRIDLRPYLRSEGEAFPVIEELERIRESIDGVAHAIDTHASTGRQGAADRE